MEAKNDILVLKTGHQVVISYTYYQMLMECHEALERADCKILVDLLFVSMNNRSGRRFNKSKSIANLIRFGCIKALAPKFDEIPIDIDSLMDEIHGLEDTAMKCCNVAEAFTDCCREVESASSEHVGLYVREFEKLRDFRRRLEMTSRVISFLGEWLGKSDSDVKLTFLTVLGNVFQHINENADRERCHLRGDDLVLTPDASIMLGEWNYKFEDDEIYITDLYPSITQQ